MFYAENDFNEIVNCNNCKKKYTDPRTLPCDEQICQSCITNLLSTENNGIECPYCSNFHQTPENGFPQNKLLLKLLQKKPNEVYRGKLVENLKSQLYTIENACISLCAEIKNSKNKIKTHCDEVKNLIEVEAESAHATINKIKAEQLKKVDDYEKESFKVGEQESYVYKHDISLLIKENKEFTQKWTDYLKEFKIDEQQLEAACEEATSHLNKIKREQKDIDKKIFNGKLIRFEASKKLEPSLFGSIYYEDLAYFKIKNNKLTVLDLETNLIDYPKNGSVYIDVFQNKSILLFYKSNNQNHNNFTLKLVDLESRFIQKMINFDFESSLKKFETIKNLIYIIGDFETLGDDVDFRNYANDPNNTLALNEQPRLWIKCFDENLNAIKEARLSYQAKHFKAYKDELFCVSELPGLKKTKYFLDIYDSNLNKLKTVGQPNESFPYYFGDTFIQFDVNQSFYFLLEFFQIKLMNRSDGLIARKLRFSTFNFYLHLEKNILSYNIREKKLFCYDLEGNKVFEEEINIEAKLISSKSDELIFYDANKTKLIFLS